MSLPWIDASARTLSSSSARADWICTDPWVAPDAELPKPMPPLAFGAADAGGAADEDGDADGVLPCAVAGAVFPQPAVSITRTDVRSERAIGAARIARLP